MQASLLHGSRFALVALAVAGGFAVFGRAADPPLSNAPLLAEADARIEKHRKADATVTVRDATGNPVGGATVRLEQTRHAFLFGCNIFLWGKAGDAPTETAYRTRFTDVFNFATLPFYWPMYEPRRGQPIHESTEQVARWCQARDLICKGHPLAWNFAEPGWLPDDATQIHELQLARIDDCVARFKGLIDRWDVVNEATHFDRDEFKKAAPKMTAMWAQVGQLEFTRSCFRHARQTNPQATLLINDYRTDAAYQRLIESLVDDQGKRLYDVIGIQSHQHGGPWKDETVWATCERFARFGLPLHFTETTIVSGPRPPGRARGDFVSGWSTTPEGEAKQAEAVERFYTLLFSHPAVAAITWWDFADRHAWQGAPAGFLRKDLSPKPSYDRLHTLIKERWWTRARLVSNAQGEARVRAFLGDYKVTVTTGPGREVVAKLTVAKGEPNRLVVTLP
jgi:endo-1,4-beta-xylanase